jgi:hypothetical protein
MTEAYGLDFSGPWGIKGSMEVPTGQLAINEARALPRPAALA